jgi:hypothetical protein
MVALCFLSQVTLTLSPCSLHVLLFLLSDQGTLGRIPRILGFWMDGSSDVRVAPLSAFWFSYLQSYQGVRSPSLTLCSHNCHQTHHAAWPIRKEVPYLFFTPCLRLQGSKKALELKCEACRGSLSWWTPWRSSLLLTYAHFRYIKSRKDLHHYSFKQRHALLSLSVGSQPGHQEC